MTARPHAKRLAELPGLTHTHVGPMVEHKPRAIPQLDIIPFSVLPKFETGLATTLIAVTVPYIVKGRRPGTSLVCVFGMICPHDCDCLHNFTAWLSSSLLTWIDWLLDYPVHYRLIRVLTGQTAFPLLIPSVTPRVQYYSWLVYMIGNVLCLTCAYTSLQSTWVLQWHDYLSSACQLLQRQLGVSWYNASTRLNILGAIKIWTAQIWKS